MVGSPLSEKISTFTFIDTLIRWPNDLIHFPLGVQQNLSSFLFSEDGLHLSSYRYNVGADGNDDVKQVTTNGSRIESFLLRNGTYDWDGDHAGVTFLKAAQKYKVPYITFFVTAAPSHIADNGAACGWNMTAAKIPAFSKYLQTVLSHWIEAGINVNYISPVNEPDNLRADCGQEGMALRPSLRAELAQTLRKELDTSTAAKVGIIYDETIQITTQAIPQYPEWLPESLDSMYSIAVHNYDFPTDAGIAEYRQTLLNLTNGHPPRVKFTETCCTGSAANGQNAFKSQHDPTMNNALVVARHIWQFLTIAEVESFDWWTAVSFLPCSPKIDGPQCYSAINETAGYNSALIYIDPNFNQTGDYGLHFTKRAFMLKHYSYFHRPGSVRYDVPQSQLPYGVNAFASAISSGVDNAKSNGTVWNLLFFNNQTEPCELNVSSPSPAAKLVQTVETTDQVDWNVARFEESRRGGSVKRSIPGQGMVTLQFES